MPYKLSENGLCVVKKDTGETVKCHKTHEEAVAHMQALMINVPDAKSLKAMMGEMSGADYARSQCWDVAAAAGVLGQVAQLCMSEVEEPGDLVMLADIMYSLIEYIRGEVGEMEKASEQGAKESVPAQVAAPNAMMNLSYVKSLGIEVPDLAVKYVSLDTIKGYTFLWGNPGLTDVEREFFTRESDFWDGTLGKSPRPLTWDHAQDEDFKAAPVIGQIVDFGDDDVGRWYAAKLERAHKYRKAIDALIEQGKLGTSSDSAPQYVERVKTGKATWLKTWPWFASALTDVPCEPRMIDSIEYLKSLGVTLPDAPDKTAWEWGRMRFELFKIKHSEIIP